MDLKRNRTDTQHVVLFPLSWDQASPHRASFVLPLQTVKQPVLSSQEGSVVLWFNIWKHLGSSLVFRHTVFHLMDDTICLELFLCTTKREKTLTIKQCNLFYHSQFLIFIKRLFLLDTCIYDMLLFVYIKKSYPISKIYIQSLTVLTQSYLHA